MLLTLSKGILPSLSVFNPCNNQETQVEQPIAKQEPNRTNLLPKQHNPFDVRKRNHKALKSLQSLSVEPQGFLTLLSNVNNPVIFRSQFKKFATWFSRKYSQGWLFYWFELDVYGNIHSHILFHSGDSQLLLSDFESVCRRKWSLIQSDGNPELTKVTPFHVHQLGYIARRDKLAKSIRLLDLFQKSQTYGFIGKSNVSFVRKEIYQLTEVQCEQVKRLCLRNMNSYDFKTMRTPNYAQINRILSGFFAHHFLSELDLSMLNVIIYWLDLVALHGVADEGFLDDLPAFVFPDIPANELEDAFPDDEHFELVA